MKEPEFYWMKDLKQSKGWTEISRLGWYNTKEWKELRKIALARNPICMLCEQEGKLTPAKEVNHIIPATKDKTKFFDLNNLQPLCTYHHRVITRRENSRYARLDEGKQLQIECENE